MSMVLSGIDGSHQSNGRGTVVLRLKDELLVSEIVGDEERHWTFKLKGSNRKAYLERYWSRTLTEDGYVSGGWYRTHTPGRTLELKDVPRMVDESRLIEWCRVHETDVPRIHKAAAPRKRKTTSNRSRGRPAGSMDKNSASHKIRRALLKDPDVPTAKLIEKHGVSRQLVSSLRKTIKARNGLVYPQQGRNIHQDGHAHRSCMDGDC